MELFLLTSFPYGYSHLAKKNIWILKFEIKSSIQLANMDSTINIFE